LPEACGGRDRETTPLLSWFSLGPLLPPISAVPGHVLECRFPKFWAAWSTWRFLRAREERE